MMIKPATNRCEASCLSESDIYVEISARVFKHRKIQISIFQSKEVIRYSLTVSAHSIRPWTANDRLATIGITNKNNQSSESFVAKSEQNG